MQIAAHDTPPKSESKPGRFHTLLTRQNSLAMAALGIDRPIQTLTITERVGRSTVVTVEFPVTEDEAGAIRGEIQSRRYRLVPIEDDAEKAPTSHQEQS